MMTGGKIIGVYEDDELNGAIKMDIEHYLQKQGMENRLFCSMAMARIADIFRDKLKSFVCKVCGKTVVPTGAGSDHRNHCPYCLSSQHMDNEPGDRAAGCGGVMEPIAVWVRKNGEGLLFIAARYVGH